MKNTRVWLWVTIVVVVIGVALAVFYAGRGGVSSTATQTAEQSGVSQGRTAPEFTAATNQGYFDLSKTPKPVFLEVFATWCPHCQRETAVIDQLYQRYKNQVAFVAVSGNNTSMDRQGQSSEQDVLTFVQDFHVRYPSAFDGSLDVAHKYLQAGFPTMVLIDRNKTVAYVTSGETPYSELDSAIRSVLR